MLVAILLPYFLPLVSIVSDISVVLVIYILPPIFFLKLVVPKIHPISVRVIVILGMCFLIAFGITGSVLGLMQAIPSLIKAVETGGNPFDSFLSFGCPDVKNGTIRNLTCFLDQ